MRKRDSQRSKVYRAQWASQAYKGAERFPTFAAAREWAITVCLAELPRRLGNASPHVPEIVQGRSNSAARAYGSWRISLPEWAWNKATILHEIAHIAMPAERHGRLWAKRYAELVEKYMGKAAAAELKASFRAHGVKYSAPRNLTLEQRQALRERAKLMRAKLALSHT